MNTAIVDGFLSTKSQAGVSRITFAKSACTANAAGKSWLATHPDDRVFWIDQDIGRRLSALMDTILVREPQAFGVNQAHRAEIDSLLGSLVRMGVPEAHRLETNLRLI